MSTKPTIQVKDVMVTEFDLVERIDTIDSALKNAKFLDNECLIVNRRDEDDEFGILMLADIAKEVLAKNKSPERVNVYEIMSKPVISVSPNMNIRYCARLFNKFGLNRAPVIKDNKILGVVSFKDIVVNGVLDSLQNPQATIEQPQPQPQPQPQDSE